MTPHIRATAETVRTELIAKIRELVNIAPGNTVKERLRATARHLDLPFSRVQNFWYDEAHKIEAHEADRIRAYYEAAKEIVDAKAEYERRHRDMFDSNI